MIALGATLILALLSSNQEDFRYFPLVHSNGININQGEWEIARYSRGNPTIILKRKALQANHIWLRYEFVDADSTGALSHIDLVQIDCRTKRTRVVQSDSFRLNNFQDHITRIDDLEWSVPLPATLLEEVVIDTCSMPPLTQ